MATPFFKSSRGSITDSDIKNALLTLGADQCDILYIHTGMTFGLPLIKRKALLNELLKIMESLAVPTLVFPTFTFSFCNNEVFDCDNTPTGMGALNEFVRKTGRGVRSPDPILSIYALGNDLGTIRALTENLSEYSIGQNSSYDRLHQLSKSGKNIKFLFFGTDMRECFTYTHYAEAILGVPYRYNKEFKGHILKNGVSTSASVYLYSTYGNCVLNPFPVVHDHMEEAGMLNKAQVGDGSICCFTEKDGFETLAKLMRANPYCLTDGHFDPEKKDYTYNKSGSRVISVL